ncbi:aldo/keto reductase [Embleya sp. AB8]|uniref:aldo/keto reductase n=1 Tax=Embleya sp. AB8 TaxID=3156304 RepID=UPI003C71AA47
MEYTPLGRTGMRVSRLCLGTMMFGAWGNPDHDECVRMVHRALDAGINFIDTADVYAFGESERILAKALKGRRDDVVLATKFGEAMDPDAPLRRGASRRWIIRAVEDSLRRLDTDHLDLYQLHRPDPGTDPDETLGALSDLVRQGKVRTIGSSALPAEGIVEAQWIAERRGHERFAVEQLAYSAFARHAENAALPTCGRYGLGVLVFSPLNGGWLTGKYRAGTALSPDSRAVRNADHFDHADAAIRATKTALVEEFAEIATEAGCTLPELALAFTLAHPNVTAAVIGPRTPAQLESQLAACEVKLPPETLRRLDALVPPGTDVNPADSPYPRPVLRREKAT